MEDDLYNPFESEDVTPPFSAHWEAKRRLARAVRELTEVMVTCDPPIEDMEAIASQLEEQARHLAETPRLYGRMAFQSDGKHGARGEVNHELNAVGGWSNPLSPGLNAWIEGDRAYATVTCGWAYEGPPEHVHGGYVAALFDQFMGMAQFLGEQPGMTGRLTVKYHSPTPLNRELRMEAWLAKSEGRKTGIEAEMRVGDRLTATCEALFIAPRSGLDNLRQE
jgi:hypothetical protein